MLVACRSCSIDRLFRFLCPAICTAYMQPTASCLPNPSFAVLLLDLTRPEPALQLVDALSAHSAPVLAVGWSQDESRVVSADKRGTVVVWQALSAEEETLSGSSGQDELQLAPRAHSV